MPLSKRTESSHSTGNTSEPTADSHISFTPPAYSTSYPYTNLLEKPQFRVLIVGAGIGGLMLGYCLERAGIDYVVLERMQQLQVPKTTIQLTSNTLYALEQMGLLDEVMAIAKPISGITLRKHNMSVVGNIDCTFAKERYGYYSYIVHRTEFCQVLISKMRFDRVLWGRYVLDVVSGDAGVQVRCANGYVEQASVLVGADGAHSAVRQNLYRNLKDKGLLPKADAEALKFTQNALIGLTNPLNPSQYPGVSSEFGECNIVIGKDSPYTLWISPVSGDKVNWSVTGPMLTNNIDNENFMVSQFGQEEAERTCLLIKDLKIPFGGTLADLIKNTSRECITKILVEEKHYKTWHHGRTVLIGEACHKFVSFSGQGAEQAIMDAICLANLFHKLECPYTHTDIRQAFEAYQAERLPATKAAVQSSGQVANMINSQGWSADLKRRLVFNLPTWVQAASVDKTQVRPMLDFLPPIENRGTRSVRSLKLEDDYTSQSSRSLSLKSF
ncbi:hypothetical protein BGZ95_008761 [Linnemannia exigua]|uniref:FAD-binding domain-containing protein n=1 Tax=Linnemannia exigua TaxID=604196 RepID=A0AAD4DEA1_9FUNG|nr:hypothetical protein BGZ95_008761 [Linnemannia exigua]